jgi:integrase
MKIWTDKDKYTKRTVWCADFTCAGRRHKPKASTRDELFDIVEAIRKRARQEEYGLPIDAPAITLGQLTEMRKSDFDEKNKNESQIRRILDKFCACLGPDFELIKMKTAHVRLFVVELKARGLQNQSINTYLGYVNAMLRKAGEFFAELDSWKSPAMPYEDTEDYDGRQRIITEEEQARLLFELRAPVGLTSGEQRPRRESAKEVRLRHTVADLLDTSLLTGLRLNEARPLTKQKIDWTIRTVADPHTGDELTIYGEVILTKTKTKRKRRVPLNSDARAILERRAKEATGPWLFGNMYDTAPISEKSIYNNLRRAAERARVPYGMNVEDGFVFHDSRHTAVTMMLQRGADLKTVDSIVGHADETMTMKYSHPSARSRASAVGSLERLKHLDHNQRREGG